MVDQITHGLRPVKSSTSSSAGVRSRAMMVQQMRGFPIWKTNQYVRTTCLAYWESAYATQLFNDPQSLYFITVSSLSVSSSTQEVLFTTDSKETSQAEIVDWYKHC